MEIDRRGLLKMFGIGAVIAPVVAGSAVMPAAARIIEAPRVEIVDSQSFLPLFDITKMSFEAETTGHDEIVSANLSGLGYCMASRQIMHWAADAYIDSLMLTSKIGSRYVIEARLATTGSSRLMVKNV